MTQVTFRPGKPVDFDAVVKAIDDSGFPAQAIRVVATGWVVDSQGRVAFKVGGTNQIFPVREGGQYQHVVALKGSGQPVKVTATVDLKAPHAWVVQELGPTSQALRRGTSASPIKDVSGHTPELSYLGGGRVREPR